MTVADIIQRYVAYNHWANETQVKWLKTLDARLLYTETHSSFGSIDRTIQHIVHAQNYWLAIINEGDISMLDDTFKTDAIDAVKDALKTALKERRRFDV